MVKYVIRSSLLVIFSLLTVNLYPLTVKAEDSDSYIQWQEPFDSENETAIPTSDSLPLEAVLNLVGQANPGLKAIQKQVEAMDGLVNQAGLRPNPELEIEFEEVGWDAPGFDESEIGIVLSQEFELWGKRKNRKKLAKSELAATEFESIVSGFELRAMTMENFYTLVNTQKQVVLARQANEIAEAIASTTKTRIEKGAGLSAELLLAELEHEQTKLELDRANSQLHIAKRNLASMWKGDESRLIVAEPKLDKSIISRITGLQPFVKNNREAAALEHESKILKSQLSVEKSEGKPNLTFSGGVKRLQADDSNSFVLALGIPLSIFNRNQGTVYSLRTQSEAIKLAKEQAQLNAEAEFLSLEQNLRQLLSRYNSIDTLLLPLSEKAYRSLDEAYKLGRIPYSTLLESQRSLVDLRFEINDLELEIRKEIGSIERLLGIKLN
jgi:cobalt-zinc-cadmium efflux system outer membrane protein